MHTILFVLKIDLDINFNGDFLSPCNTNMLLLNCILLGVPFSNKWGKNPFLWIFYFASQDIHCIRHSSVVFVLHCSTICTHPFIRFSNSKWSSELTLVIWSISWMSSGAASFFLFLFKVILVSSQFSQPISKFLSWQLFVHFFSRIYHSSDIVQVFTFSQFDWYCSW